MGTVYGNVATNGGTIVRSNQIHGTIDNNVPLNIPPYTLPRRCHYHNFSQSTFSAVSRSLLWPRVRQVRQTLYLLSSLTGNLTVNAIGGAETFVALHVTGDITGKITVNPKVHLQVYFDGNVSVKSSRFS